MLVVFVDSRKRRTKLTLPCKPACERTPTRVGDRVGKNALARTIRFYASLVDTPETPQRNSSHFSTRDSTMNPSERTKEALLGMSASPQYSRLQNKLIPHWRVFMQNCCTSMGDSLVEHLLTTFLAKTEALCSSIYDLRKDDPWGGNGYLSTILRATKMQDTVPHPTAPNETIELPPSWDYATSAQKELVIKEQTAALVSQSYILSAIEPVSWGSILSSSIASVSDLEYGILMRDYRSTLPAK
jgi:hypothetical protein